MVKTGLDLIADTDTFPYPENTSAESEAIRNDLWTLLWEDDDGAYPIGYMLDRVLRELIRVPVSIKGEMDFNEQDRTVILFREPTEPERTSRAAALAGHWRHEQTFKLLRGWRGELWPVYGRKGELLFSVERAAVGLLGTMRYGVHMTAFVRDAAAPHGIRLWVPRRAADKSTFPGMLDNTVAGGLMTGEDPDECIIREADEEASLPDAVVRAGARRVGTVTYTYISEEEHIGEGGFIYPECQWIYELELPAEVVPEPKDGEAEEFRLCDVDHIRRDLAAGKYKNNCALVIVDFFIRHGILTDDDEPDMAEIKRRIHRPMPFPGPHQPEWPASLSSSSSS